MLSVMTSEISCCPGTRSSGGDGDSPSRARRNSCSRRSKSERCCLPSTNKLAISEVQRGEVKDNEEEELRYSSAPVHRIVQRLVHMSEDILYYIYINA